ncbi:MAG: DUF3999 family protein [Terracidiphilus sp.]
MKILVALALLFLAAPAPEIHYFHFERPIVMPSQSSGQTCLIVDTSLFAHASSQLADLRLYQGTSETPYLVRSDVPVTSSEQSISPLNLGQGGNGTVFDAEMPAGKYSDLQLNVDGRDFLATVTVSGSQTQTAASRTRLGEFTIFDLTKQRLGRSTILHLPESDFRFLHFQIAGPIIPEDVKGLSVTRVPVSQPKFVTIAQAATSTLRDRNSIFEFTVPAHTPVDRILFVPGQNPPSFSRDVEISVSPVSRPQADDSAEPPQPFTTSGNILRVHTVRDGHRIDEEHLVVNAPQVYYDGPAKWTVTIENRDDVPVQITAVGLEMLERKLCFDATAGGVYTLYYGDTALTAPQYDYAALFVLQQNAVVAQLGAETANSSYQPRPDERPFTEKHPALLWIALVLVIALLGAVAFRSFKATPPSQ